MSREGRSVRIVAVANGGVECEVVERPKKARLSGRARLACIFGTHVPCITTECVPDTRISQHAGIRAGLLILLVVVMISLVNGSPEADAVPNSAAGRDSAGVHGRGVVLRYGIWPIGHPKSHTKGHTERTVPPAKTNGITASAAPFSGRFSGRVGVGYMPEVHAPDTSGGFTFHESTGRYKEIWTSCPSARGIACAGHGTCTNQGCRCNEGFTGVDCSGVVCPSSQGIVCAGHGTCTNQGCRCNEGSTGTDCSKIICPSSQGVVCAGHGTCTN